MAEPIKETIDHLRDALSWLGEPPTITGKQMSETLSVSQRTIERDLSALQKVGVLKREGKDNNGVWIVETMLFI